MEAASRVSDRQLQASRGYYRYRSGGFRSALRQVSVKTYGVVVLDPLVPRTVAAARCEAHLSFLTGIRAIGQRVVSWAMRNSVDSLCIVKERLETLVENAGLSSSGTSDTRGAVLGHLTFDLVESILAIS